jgi:xanthosine phosphorylase
MTDLQELIRLAREAHGRAYAPYSRFRVGACIKGAGGALYVGTNVENASYPQGQCAESSALGAMIAGGERQIAEIAIVGDGEGLCTPCGGCRQRLREFAAEDVPVHICGTEGLRRTLRLGELLPFSFGPGQLDAEAAPTVPMAAETLIRDAAPGLRPRALIVLGSGLGGVADALTDGVSLAYGALPGFPIPSLHEGSLAIGRLGGVDVACMRGRVHLYEGAAADAMAGPIRILKSLGAEILIVTNAAGSLNRRLRPGALMTIRDHINMTARNPLIGPNHPAGPRFPDMAEAYDPGLRKLLARAAKRLGISLGEGVYVAVPGPTYETPAEIEAFRRLGADAVGMSTVLETIAARHAGLKVVGLSLITNMAAGMVKGPIDHDGVLARSGQATPRVTRLLAAFLQALDRRR